MINEIRYVVVSNDTGHCCIWSESMSKTAAEFTLERLAAIHTDVKSFRIAKVLITEIEEVKE